LLPVAKKKQNKRNLQDFPANSTPPLSKQELKFDFEDLIAPELRALVGNWKLVLLRNRPCDHSNQRSCLLSVSHKSATPTLVWEQLASTPPAH
jgi:hypothetical protein